MTLAILKTWIESIGGVPLAIAGGLAAIVAVGLFETVRQEIKLKREVARRRMGKSSD